jgi:hypothetical protein
MKKVVMMLLVSLCAATSARATYTFTENFTDPNIVAHDWADGDNGWAVDEVAGSYNRAAVESAGHAKLYANSVFPEHGPSVYKTTDSMQKGNVTFDFMDGYGNSDLRLAIAGAVGGQTIQIYFGASDGNLTGYAPGVGDFLTSAAGIGCTGTNWATISVDFDVSTKMFALTASSTDGDHVGPISFPFQTAVTDIHEFGWILPRKTAGGSEWNTTHISITEVPEPATMGLLLGGLLMGVLRRRRA